MTFKVNWPRGSYVRAWHVKWTDGQMDSRILVCHNASRLKDGCIKTIGDTLECLRINMIKVSDLHGPFRACISSIKFYPSGPECWQPTEWSTDRKTCKKIKTTTKYIIYQLWQLWPLITIEKVTRIILHPLSALSLDEVNGAISGSVIERLVYSGYWKSGWKKNTGETILTLIWDYI